MPSMDDYSIIQRVALQNPCRYEIDTRDLRYRRLYFPWSSTVTVVKWSTERGPVPIWHSSASYMPGVKPVRYEKLTREQVRSAIKIVWDKIKTVGQGCGIIFVTKPPGCCIHAARSLDSSDIGHLPFGWLRESADAIIGDITRLQ